MAGESSNWRDAVSKLVPGWLQEHWGERLVGYVALLMDVTTVGLGEALRAPWLREETSPDDVLPLVGNERRLPQYPGETNDQYRARLIDSWNAWAVAGNQSAVVSQLEAAFPGITVEIKRNDDWDWDGDPDNWSRFWVIIHNHPWTASPGWGAGGTWGDGGVRGLSATREEIRTLRSIIQQWKAAESLNPWIIIVLDEVTWAAEQPDGTWHDWRNRSRAARYGDGRGQKPVVLP